MAGWDDSIFSNLPRRRQQPQIDWDAPPIGPADPRASMPQRIASAVTDEGARALNWLTNAATVPGDVARGRASMSDPATQSRVMDLSSLVSGGPLTGGTPEGGLSMGASRGPPPIDPTKTGWVFKDVAYPNSQMERGDWRAVNAASSTGEGVQQVNLPIRSMYATQENVNPDFMDVQQRPDQLPFVIKKNGNYYVQDGHHRIVQQAQQGQQTAPVRLLDLDGTTQTNFPLLTSGGMPVGPLMQQFSQSPAGQQTYPTYDPNQWLQPGEQGA
jgi:hypothetical protein